MLDGARVFVVVPAHNEQRLVGRMLRRVPAFVDRIIVVDDASDDGTSERARDVGDSRVQVIEHAANRGVGAAIATGYRRALADGADVVVVMAGDDQMDPRDLPALLRPVIDGAADYAKGDRLSHPDAKTCMPLSRRLGTLVLGKLTRVALGMQSLSDSQCGYTAISRRALAQLDIDHLWPRFGYPNDLLAQLTARHLRCTDVVVRPVYAGETSELKLRHVGVILCLIARGAWRVRRRGRPAQSDAGAGR